MKLAGTIANVDVLVFAYGAPAERDGAATFESAV